MVLFRFASRVVVDLLPRRVGKGFLVSSVGFHKTSYLTKQLPDNWRVSRLTAHRRSILQKMAANDASVQAILQPLRDSVKEQG